MCLSVPCPDDTQCIPHYSCRHVQYVGPGSGLVLGAGLLLGAGQQTSETACEAWLRDAMHTMHAYVMCVHMSRGNEPVLLLL